MSGGTPKLMSMSGTPKPMQARHMFDTEETMNADADYDTALSSVDAEDEQALPTRCVHRTAYIINRVPPYLEGLKLTCFTKL